MIKQKRKGDTYKERIDSVALRVNLISMTEKL